MDPNYRHILLSNDTGERLELQDAPIGWDATRFQLVRDLTYLGILKSISVEFEFVGDGFKFLQSQRLHYGIDADVIIRVYKRNPNEFIFEGKVNQENYLEDRKFNKYKVDVIQSGFVQSFQNREDVKLNILNTLSLDRAPIPAAGAKSALIRGRQINFNALFEGVTIPDPIHYHHTLPFQVKSNGNTGNVFPDNMGIIQIDGNTTLTDTDPPEELMSGGAFFTNNLPGDQTIVFNWAANYNSTYVGEGQFYGNFHPHTVIAIRRVDADGVPVANVYENIMRETFGNFNLSGSHTVVVPAGHSLVFTNEQWFTFGSDPELKLQNNSMMDGLGFPTQDLQVDYVYNSLSMTISQDSVVTDSSHPVILPHEIFSNLIAQINGGQFYSEFFGREELGYDADGLGAYLSITKGELLRGIALDQIQIAMSFREAFRSYSSVFCLGALIEKETIRVEPLDLLFNANISAHIGEVKELVIGPTKEFLFNSVRAGYPPNEYEEQNGRDEFNTEYQYTNPLKAVKNELDLTSVFYGDGYGIEFARRQSIINTGTKDTKYDNQIFFVDLIKEVDGSLISRRQEGILHVAGIFSPETALNLNIAVGQNMLRHKKFLNIPLHKKEKVYYFQSKDKNAGLELITPLGETIDGQDLATTGGAYFLPEQHGFNCPVTLDILFAILANPLGIVSYTYNGEKFFDLLFEVNATIEKATAQWKTLGTKETPVEIEEDTAVGNYLKYNQALSDFLKYGNGEEDFILYQ